MGKKLKQQDIQDKTQPRVHKNSKANRFEDVLQQPKPTNKKSWPTNAVVYIGHLPHGFFEQQLKQYFTQYGEVLGIKLARARATSRSKGYAFIQFKYPQVAEIVAQAMNNYLLMGKVLTAHVLSTNLKNPFSYSTSKKYKFINWKRLFIKNKNKEKVNNKFTNKLAVYQEMRRQKIKISIVGNKL